MADNSIILGIDVGYSHTKTVSSKGEDVFRSTVREGVIDINPNSTVIEFEGKEYTMGERGRITVDSNKIYDKNFELCLLTAILRNADDRLTTINVDLVTGLPVSYYKTQKDELKKSLMNKRVTMGYNGKDRTINIKDVIVFPQSAGLPLINPKDFEEGKTNLVIDIGGITVDVSYFEGRKLTKFKSYQLGMIKFYSMVAGEIANEFNVEVSNEDVERFIEQNGVMINEESRKFDFDSLFEQHMDEILTKIKTDFPYDIVHKKNFIGGGSIRFKDFLPKNKGVNTDEVLTNANAFYAVGVQKFG
ncbi:ParM/StbA family protein [Virgibacillus sp. M23]|uniref:ParM/StbA family protein n=1 Tax=Virgibacillus sp. M23 TaxID=3079030 RepID=UPI002A91EA30|nr:ParM/StbA family protein [Virgibacillus sp. M23]MDY7043664.1 ParM/StbA family protein [Virgibacillus sp. M23]